MVRCHEFCETPSEAILGLRRFWKSGSILRDDSDGQLTESDAKRVFRSEEQTIYLQRCLSRKRRNEFRGAIPTLRSAMDDDDGARVIKAQFSLGRARVLKS